MTARVLSREEIERHQRVGGPVNPRSWTGMLEASALAALADVERLTAEAARLRVLVMAQSMRNEEALAVLRGHAPMVAAAAEVERRRSMPTLFEPAAPG